MEFSNTKGGNQQRGICPLCLDERDMHYYRRPRVVYSKRLDGLALVLDPGASRILPQDADG
jgi:hypothetical protein